MNPMRTDAVADRLAGWLRGVHRRAGEVAGRAPRTTNSGAP
jgi:hypothetical protein